MRPQNSNALPKSKRNLASNTPHIPSGNTASTPICYWDGKEKNGRNEMRIGFLIALIFEDAYIILLSELNNHFII